MTAATIANREGLPEYDVNWAWADSTLEPGITAVLRVKNEARNLPWVLPPLLRAVDQVLFVDNGSTDDSAAVARACAEQVGLAARLQVRDYPFDLSRCGAEHLATPADSVHSLTHFCNWSFSQAQTRYTLKWDGDMVLTAEGSALIAALGWQILREEVIVAIPFAPLYVESDRVGYVDVQMRHSEPWLYPVGPDYGYAKGFDWEIRQAPLHVPKTTLPEGMAFELKWLDTDEFAHWTTGAEFHPQRNARKRREQAVFHALNEGRAEEVSGIARVEAPAGVHIVDHVARTWLLPPA